MNLNRQLVLVSVTSGAATLGLYFLLRKLFATKQTRSSKPAQSKIYEEQALLDQYMLFNFSEPNELLLFDLNDQANINNCFLFPKRVALLCRDYCPDLFFSSDEQTGPRTALDVGCAVGRSCFELSKLFDSVIGIDYSVNFIDYCNKFLQEKEINYECTLEGNINQKLTARLDPDVRADRLSFEVGDACNLRADLGEFNLVLASNLICRLTEPMKFFNRLKSLVKKNGYVILSTPFTWGAQYTPESNWLGGYYDANGRAILGIDGLKSALSDSFVLIKELNMPMVIRETKRKFQFTVCLVTIWQKK